MAEENIFSINEAVLSNLKRLSKEQSILTELRIYELYDIALEMAENSSRLFDDGLDAYEILSLLSESIELGDYPIFDKFEPAFGDLITRCHTMLSSTDRILLTELYLDICRRNFRALTEGDFLPGAYGEETFTYVRNSLADEAYDVFSQDFQEPRVRYSHTLKDAAAAVSSGEVTYCLLPLEERGGARLHTVSDIIFRNDFKINSVISVFGIDGNADIKYALVSKSFIVPERAEDDDMYLEIRLGKDSDTSLSELCYAVDRLEMSVYRVNTLTFETEGESETYFSVVIKGGKGDFSPILTYMTLFLRDFVPLGIYKNIE